MIPRSLFHSGLGILTTQRSAKNKFCLIVGAGLKRKIRPLKIFTVVFAEVKRRKFGWTEFRPIRRAKTFRTFRLDRRAKVPYHQRQKSPEGMGSICRQTAKSGRYQVSFMGPELRRHFAPMTFDSRLNAERWLVREKDLIEKCAAASLTRFAITLPAANLPRIASGRNS